MPEIYEKSSNIIAIRKGINDIKDVFKDYIQITKTYCTEIASLALKLKPLANTIWGDLTQAIQGILLFNSISLENLAKGMGEIFKNSKIKKRDSGDFFIIIICFYIPYAFLLSIHFKNNFILFNNYI